MHQSQMLINGEEVASLSGKVEIIYNPANQEPVAEVAVGTRQDAQAGSAGGQEGFSHLVGNLQPRAG